MTQLSPESLNQIKRLDLRARMIVRGFLQGLHHSPFHGFSVQFSEHRRYHRGDDPKLIDWLVYAKTDKYYVKRFEAETNLTGYLVMDLSGSMGFKHTQPMTKFEYAICLAASLCYLMTMQQDPVGLITFADRVQANLPARSRRGHFADVLGHLSRMTPAGETDLGGCLTRVATMLRHTSLVMLFSDLLGDPAETLAGLARLRHGGHDVIVFHVLDQAEIDFPFVGAVELEDPETGERFQIDAGGYRDEYLSEVERFREAYREGCGKLQVDYVPLSTEMPFDKALTEYLINRQSRF
ncbi:MAG: DUF58 domain-containing protein [Planctomycetaceae bacterium]|nr:MAG: DUF58 domain-containing protein [Planctomycetaceae bacterium]